MVDHRLLSAKRRPAPPSLNVSCKLTGRETLCQEGHSCHATRADAEQTALDILDLYKKVYDEVLAVPLIKGIKTERDKYPGALYTTSLEAVIPTFGLCAQAAESHNLGQSFANAYGLHYINAKGNREFVWQTSWRFTAVAIALTVLMHGDDKGLVLPPRIAPVQLVLIPIITIGYYLHVALLILGPIW